MTLQELLAAIERGGSMASNNRKNTVRSAAHNTRLMASTGDGRYDYVPGAVEARSE